MRTLEGGTRTEKVTNLLLGADDSACAAGGVDLCLGTGYRGAGATAALADRGDGVPLFRHGR